MSLALTSTRSLANLSTFMAFPHLPESASQLATPPLPTSLTTTAKGLNANFMKRGCRKQEFPFPWLVLREGHIPLQDVGTYEWDQVISNDSYSYTVGGNTTTCNGPVGLDNGIPTVEGFIYSDSPGRSLPPTDNEFTWSWNSTVYLMWNPGLTNSIRVPLGYVSWSFFADVVQNLSTNTWTVQSDSSKQTTLFTASSSYPQWNSVVKNGSLGGCP